MHDRGVRFFFNPGGGFFDRGVQIDDHADGERVREEREGHAEELQSLGGEHRQVVGDLADDG